MKKIICLIVSTFIFIGLLTGCRNYELPTELHKWHSSGNDQRTGIIYEIRSIPFEVLEDTLHWDPNNIEIEFKFGWDKDRIPNFIPINENLELYSFAAYFFWPEANYGDFNLICDDYKNPTDAIFLKEIPADEFLSDKYKASYGAGIIDVDPPIFNKSHESLIVKLTEDVFTISEEKQLDNYTSFRFGVSPVYKNKLGGYTLFFGNKYDGFRFKISRFTDNDYVYLSTRP